MAELGTILTAGTGVDLTDDDTNITIALDSGSQTSLGKADTAVQPAAIADFAPVTGADAIVVLTQAAYDALPNPADDTLYIITPTPLYASLSGSGQSWAYSDDSLMESPFGDYELQMRLRIPQNEDTKALWSTPDPWVWWAAFRGNGDINVDNPGGSRASIGSWTHWGVDATLRVTRVGDVTSMYYRVNDGDAFTLIGTDTETQSGTTSARLYLGSDGSSDMWAGRIYYARLWVGGDADNGTPRFDFNPTRDAAGTGATTWVSATTGETWTLGSGAELAEVSP